MIKSDHLDKSQKRNRSEPALGVGSPPDGIECVAVVGVEELADKIGDLAPERINAAHFK